MTGSDVGGGSHVRGWTVAGAKLAQPDLMAYPTFAGGVRVAAGDVDGDGSPEIVTGPGPTGAGLVRAFDAATHEVTREVTSFAGQYGGVYVASADLTGDGKAEVVAGAAGGTSDIQVFDGASGRRSASFQTRFAEYGARVAAADVNGDGRAEIVASPGSNSVGLPQLKLYRADGGNPCGCGVGTPFRTLTPFTPDEMRDGLGGIPLAAGDVDGDGRAEIVVLGMTTSGTVMKVLDATTGATLASIRPYGDQVSFESEVALGDVDGDGRAEIVISGFRPDGSEIRIYDRHLKLLGSFYSLDPDLVPRLSLAVADLNADGKGEILAGGGPSYQPPFGEQRVAIFDRTGRIESGFVAYESFFSGGVRVSAGNLRGDGVPEIVTAPGTGRPVEIEVFDLQGQRLASFLPFGPDFRGGAYVAVGDLDGDRVCEIVVGGGEGGEPRVKVFDGSGRELRSFLAFEPSFRGGVRVAVGDLEGDGTSEIVAGTGHGGSNRVNALDAHGNLLHAYAPFSPEATDGVFVAAGDLDGNGGAEIVAGTESGEPALVKVLDAVSGDLRTTRPIVAAPMAAHVATGDVDQDGIDELIVATGSASGGQNSQVLVFPTYHRGYSFEAYEPGGFVGSFVAAPARVGPGLLAKGTAIRAAEGKPFTGLVATFTDLAGRSTADAFDVAISWGDGEVSNGAIEPLDDGRFRVLGKHLYRDGGRRRLVVHVWEHHGRVVAATSVARVRPAAFVATGVELRVRAKRVFTRFVASVSDGDSFTMPADLAATILWGDGSRSTSRVIRAAPGRLRIIGRHRYTLPGTYRVLVPIRDVDGRRATARSVIRVAR